MEASVNDYNVELTKQALKLYQRIFAEVECSPYNSARQDRFFRVSLRLFHRYKRRLHKELGLLNI
jgi:hypothetical protein